MSKSTLSEMLKGFGSLDDIAASYSIDWRQSIYVWLAVMVVVIYKIFVMPWRRKKKNDLFVDLDNLKNLKLNISRDNISNKSNEKGPGEYFLNESDLSFFEKNGYLPPFRVISSDEAEELKGEAMSSFKNDFDGFSFLGKLIPEIEKKQGQWSIESAGLYQALRMKSFRNLMRKPQISQRMASLLGKEVICWRSQFFDKLRGGRGTIWHQNATFRETGKYAKLQPTKETDPAIIQLNAWVALTDTNQENGCLRLLPGSFVDARMDYLYSYVLDNKLFYMALIPHAFSHFYVLLKIVLYGQVFDKGMFVFLTAVELLGEDYFDRFDVVDMEMKAGECLIFSSLNMHASYPNMSSKEDRFSFVGRCTANHVRVAPSGKDFYSTAEGLIEYDLPEVSNFQVYGRDSYGYNKIMKD
ncbi:phytanoyl-CoA dioxygenase family protein [Microbulbifer sp. ANSA001]|uniref:phytanoyl-CoA dioxygenase family protein n=1 Tax=Microbulbifer sp. ANSA001 TaxID=3243358 RepID=UPI004041553C